MATTSAQQAAAYRLPSRLRFAGFIGILVSEPALLAESLSLLLSSEEPPLLLLSSLSLPELLSSLTSEASAGTPILFPLRAACGAETEVVANCAPSGVSPDAGAPDGGPADVEFVPLAYFSVAARALRANNDGLDVNSWDFMRDHLSETAVWVLTISAIRPSSGLGSAMRRRTVVRTVEILSDGTHEP